MRRFSLKKLVVLFLVLCMAVNAAPVEVLRALALSAAAEASGEGAAFDWVLEEAATRMAQGEAPLDDGIWRYYVLPDCNYAVIVGHSGTEAVRLTVPDLLGGADVVALGSNALADHRQLQELSLPGNVNALGDGALPRGTTVAGYNGTFAQAYAQDRGFAFVSRSAFDFAAGTVDFSDVREECFVRVSQYEVLLRELEASRLKEGSLFFLVDPMNAYQVSYYQVAAMEAAGNGMLRITCTTPQLEQVFNSLQGVDEKMYLDADSFRPAAGVEATSLSTSRAASDETTTGFTPEFSIKLTDHISVKIKVHAWEYTTSYALNNELDGLSFGSADATKNVTVKETTGFDITLTGKVFEIKDKSYSNIIQDAANSGSLRTSWENTRWVLETIYQEGYAGKETWPKGNMPLGTGFFASYGGIVSLEAQLALHYSLTASGSVKLTVTSTSTYTYKDGEVTKSSSSNEPQLTLNGAASGNVSVGVYLNVYLGPVVVFSAALKAGVEGKASLDVNISDLVACTDSDTELYDMSISPNMLDCLNLELKAFIDVEIKAGIVKFLSFDVNIGYSRKWRVFEWEIAKYHLHLASNTSVYDPDTQTIQSGDFSLQFIPIMSAFGTVSLILTCPEHTKDCFHRADMCPYGSRKASFKVPTDKNASGWLDITPANKYGKLETGMPICPPADLELLVDVKEVVAPNARFQGWYTDTAFTQPVEWPYVMTATDATFYACVAFENPVSCYDAGQSLICAPKYCWTGESYALPDVDDLIGWYVIEDMEQFQPGEALSPDPDTGCYSVTMGNDPINLVALCKEDIRVVYQLMIDGSLRGSFTRYARGGTELEAYTWDDEAIYCDDGWTADGTAIDFPYAIPDDASGTLVLTHNMHSASDDELETETAERGDRFYASLGTPQGSESYFYFTKTSDTTCMVTGYNKNREYYDADGIRHTYQVDATNLAIPGTYHYTYTDADGVTHVDPLKVTEIKSYAFSDISTLLAVSIPSTVKTIGGYAFNNCTNLTYVDMTSSVEVIGNRAFSGNSSLAFLQLSSNLTEIGQYAFYGTTSLSHLFLDNHCPVVIGYAAFQSSGITRARLSQVTQIDGYAFADCAELSEITLPDTLQIIGNYAFYNCPYLRELDIPEGVTSFGNFMIRGDMNLRRLTVGGYGKPEIDSVYSDRFRWFYIGEGAKLESLTIRDGVTKIGSNVFCNYFGDNPTVYYGFLAMKELTLPSTLESIGQSAFYRSCPETLNLNCPNLTSIGNNAFANSGRLRTLELSGRDATLGSSVFQDCTGLTTVSLKGVVSMGSSAFKGCAALTDMELSEGLKTIGDSAFENCTSLGALELPASVSSYGQYMIRGDLNLKHLTFGGEGMPKIDSTYSYRYNWFYIGEGAQLESLTIREGVTQIGNCVFANYRSVSPTAYFGFPAMKTISFPSTLQTIVSGAFYQSAPEVLSIRGSIAAIGDEAFAGSLNLREVRIQGSDTAIGSSTFTSCGSLQTLVIDGVSSIGSSAFKGCASLTDVEIGEGLKTIGDSAFENCTSLETLSLPASVSSYGQFMLRGDLNLKHLTFGGEGMPKIDSTYSDRYNWFYIGEGSQLESLTIREGVTQIGNCVFANYRSVSPTAYFGFPAMKTISFPSTLQTIVSGAFYQSAPEVLSIRGSIATIGDEAFAGSPNLREVRIQGSDTAIGSSTFTSCGSLQTLVIDGVSSIGSSAFKGCFSLTDVEIGEGLQIIGDSAFENCTSLETLTLPASVSSYGQYMIRGDLNLRHLTLGGYGMPEINSNYSYRYHWFYIGEGSQLESLTIREGVTQIGNCVFANYRYVSPTAYFGFPAMKTISFPSTLQTIDSRAFYQSAPDVVSITGSIAAIGTEAFANSPNLREVRIQGSNTALGSSVFANCGNLNAISLEGVESIGSSCFVNCGSLYSVHLADSLKTISTSAFENCTSLETLSLPASVSSYGQYMIRGDLNLRNLTLGGYGMPEINSNYSYRYHWFYIGEGSQLESLTIREGVTVLGSYIFCNYNYSSGRYYWFPQLKSITYPASLTQIGNANLKNLPAGTVVYFGNPEVTITDVNDLAGVIFMSASHSSTLADNALARSAMYITRDGNPEATCRVEWLLPNDAGDGFTLYAENNLLLCEVLPDLSAEAPSGQYFAGWYLDEEYKCPASGCIIYADTTLYAQFLPYPKVAFALRLPAGTSMEGLSDGGEYGLPEGWQLYQVIGQPNGTVTEIPPYPVVAGYNFTGWYLDDALMRTYDARILTDELTVLYGGFEPASVMAIPGESMDNGDVIIDHFMLTEMDGDTITIPEYVNGSRVGGIGSRAFAGLDVKEIIIPATVTLIADDAFDGATQLSSIQVRAGNASYSAAQGILYDRDRTTLIKLPEGAAITSLILPDTVRVIGRRACADNPALRRVTFNDGLQCIGEGAFSGCQGLTAVTLPATVQTLGQEAFRGCCMMETFTATGLLTIGKDALPDGIDTEFYGPTGDCALRTAVIALRGSALHYNRYLVTIMLDGTQLLQAVSEAGAPLDDGLFCADLGNGRVYNRLYLNAAYTAEWDAEAMVMPQSDLTLYARSVPLFEADTVMSEPEEGDAEAIGMKLTAYNGWASSVMLPRTLDGLPVTAIGAGFAASFTRPVSSVDIGPQVTDIEEGAFDGYEGVIRAEPGSWAEQWANGSYDLERSQYTLAFVANGGTQTPAYRLASGVAVRLPAPVRSGAAFLGWYTDDALTTPAELDEDGLFIMPAANVILYAAWQIDGDHVELFSWEETSEQTIRITGYLGTEAEATVPEEINGYPVTEIGPRALADDTLLTALTLPDTLRTVGVEAFAGSALQTIDLGGTELIAIHAFSGCQSLRSVTGANVRIISRYAFSYCAALTDFSFADTLEQIADYAFCGAGLTRAELPDSVTVLGSHAFEQCRMLQTVHLSASLTALEPFVFRGDTALTAFTAAPEANLIVYDDAVYTDGGRTLAQWPAGKRDACVPPDDVTGIGAYAFADSQVTAFTAPAGLASIGEYAFAGCEALVTMDLSAVEAGTDLHLPTGMCSGAQRLSCVTLGSGVTGIDSDAFAGCPNLRSITIPSTVEEIAEQAFDNSMSGLTIRGDAGSAAEQWAIENNVCFIAENGPVAEQLIITGPATLELGTTANLSVSVLPEAAAGTTVIRWQSVDPTVLHVDDQGSVTALKRGTTTVIAIAQNDVTGILEVEVTGTAAQTVTLTAPCARLAVGHSMQLSVELQPAWATAEGILWTSTDERVATVDDTGCVKAHSTGSFAITATAYGGRSDTLPLTAFLAVEEVLALPGETEADTGLPQHVMYAGETVDLNTLFAVQPEDATWPELAFTADSEEAATLSDSVLTAICPGRVLVTATTSQTHDGQPVEASVAVLILPLALTEENTTVDVAPCTYSGEEQTPDVTVTCAGRTLVRDVDYTLAAEAGLHAGEYGWQLTGTGNYCGELSGSYVIAPAALTLTYRSGEYNDLDAFAPDYVTSVPCTVIVRYAAADAPEVWQAQPDAPGSWLIRLTVEKTDDLLNGADEQYPLYLMRMDEPESGISCAKLLLCVGERVRVPCYDRCLNASGEGLMSGEWSRTGDAIAMEAEADHLTLTALAAGEACLTYTRSDGSEPLMVSVTVLDSIPTLSLPRALTVIEEEAFSWAGAYGEIDLPEGLRRIGQHAFREESGTAVRVFGLSAAMEVEPDALPATCVLFAPADSGIEALAAQLGYAYVYTD